MKWKRMHEDAEQPVCALPGDAGYDLSVCEDLVLRTGRVESLRTGIAVAIPEGYWGRLCGRSSAVSRGILVYEGIIDQGYRGELFIRVSTTPDQGFVRINKGDRIAQLILHPLIHTEWEEVANLPESERGDNGFGSTGR